MAILFLFFGFNVNASRGFYVSFSGVSSAQKDKVSSYTNTSRFNEISQISSSKSANVQNTQYYFATDANDNQTGYIAFSNLKNQLKDSNIFLTQEFTISANTDFTPKFQIQNALNTVTQNGNVVKRGTHTLGTITKITSSSYKVILSPHNWDGEIAALKWRAENSIKAENPFTSGAQLQSFLDAVSQKGSGFEVSIGYKIRPFKSSFFVAPQVDVSFFDNPSSQESGLFASDSLSAYTNKDLTSFSSNQTSQNTQKIQHHNLSTNFIASMVGKLGFEDYFIFENAKINYSLYGLLGGATGFRGYRDEKATNLGLKFGFGGEVFLRKNLALFAEWYQVQFSNLNIDIEESRSVNYTSEMNTTLANAIGATVQLTNGGTGTSEKTATINYASLKNIINQNLTYQNREAFKISSTITAVKMGLTYYF